MVLEEDFLKAGGVVEVDVAFRGPADHLEPVRTTITYKNAKVFYNKW